MKNRFAILCLISHEEMIKKSANSKLKSPLVLKFLRPTIRNIMIISSNKLKQTLKVKNQKNRKSDQRINNKKRKTLKNLNQLKY